jgi:hypothetical protein
LHHLRELFVSTPSTTVSGSNSALAICIQFADVIHKGPAPDQLLQGRINIKPIEHCAITFTAEQLDNLNVYREATICLGPSPENDGSSNCYVSGIFGKLTLFRSCEFIKEQCESVHRS